VPESLTATTSLEISVPKCPTFRLILVYTTYTDERQLLRIIQYNDPDRPLQDRVGLIDEETLIDLTASPQAPTSLYDIYYRHGGNRDGIVSTCQTLAESGERRALGNMLDNTSDPTMPHLRSPVTAPKGANHLLRIWLAGVTHADSAKLREIEAKQSTGVSVNVYDQKYRECESGGIPELFAKSDPDSMAAHGGDIARPANTLRLVPETELVSVYGLRQDGQVERIGFTGGNDYTDNGIEAQNPLNLPQAKNWSGGCASLGPVLVTDDAFDDAEVEVSCDIIRARQTVASKTGLTGQNHLNAPDRLFHLERSLFERIPLQPYEFQVFYWGTPIVFGDADLESGLLEGDVVRMVFNGIGELENPIVSAPAQGQLARLKP
jgi:2-dehydro-3-deoxy-D-arabinonate dehydratase